MSRPLPANSQCGRSPWSVHIEAVTSSLQIHVEVNLGYFDLSAEVRQHGTSILTLRPAPFALLGSFYAEFIEFAKRRRTFPLDQSETSLPISRARPLFLGS